MAEWTKHNGWTNYATWRVNLEIFDDMDSDYWADIIETTRGEELQAYNLGEQLRDYAEQLLECDNQLANDYAYAFINEVNFTEIAKHIIETYHENYCCDNCNERAEEKFCSDSCKDEFYSIT